MQALQVEPTITAAVDTLYVAQKAYRTQNVIILEVCQLSALTEIFGTRICAYCAISCSY